MLTASRIASLRNVLEKLVQDFDVVHIHANNFARSFYIRGIDVPKALEVTFLRRDRRKGAPTALKSLACSFDCPNTSTKADLDQEWLLKV
jgi:hypothetical protein